MKQILIVFFAITSTCYAQENLKTISGTVTDGRTPISDVSITVEGTSQNTISDNLGKYKIDASIGDVIKYSYQGMKTIKIKVEDVTRILNPAMVPDIEELEEVTVYGSNRKSQSELASEYPINPNLIRTAFGYLDAETAAGNIKFMTKEEINPVTTCILDLLRNQLSGIRVDGDCLGAFGPSGASEQELTDVSLGTGTRSATVAGPVADPNGAQSSLINGRVFVRGNSSPFNPRPAIYDVDGQIFIDTPIWIDVNNISRLAVLNNFATTTQYGNAGAGGVIVINTISGTPSKGEIVDRARLRNNFVGNNVLNSEQVKRNWPTYLSEIHASKSFEEAKNTYEKYKARYSSLPYFAFDMQKYFSEKWNETQFADDIVGANFGLFEENPVLLKALAYQYQEQGDFEKANMFYKKVLKLRPNYAQSYIDLANSYRELRDTKQAAAIYTRYNYLVEEGLMQQDSLGFAPIIEREYNNFLLLDKNVLVKGQKANDLYISEEDFKGTRLVFEWNDSEAEFDLQFVNPGKQYTLFKHSLADNAEMISNEKEYGYNMAEYLIDDSLPGKWTININYMGNKSLTPTYLKATVYYNYGSYAQRKETKVFKLTLKEAPYELFNLTVGGKLVLR